MTLKVWRGKATLFAECTQCGSYGTAGHLQLEQRVAPEIQDALDKHEAHMLTLRGHFTAAVNKIVAQISTGAIKRTDGAAQIAALQQQFSGQIIIAHNALPSPEGKIAEFAMKCPWCDAVEDVDVEALPDDIAEPPYELAKVVADFRVDSSKPKGK